MALPAIVDRGIDPARPSFFVTRRNRVGYDESARTRFEILRARSPAAGDSVGFSL